MLYLDKLTPTTATTTTTNPAQQLRAATAFLPNQAQSSTQTQQIRQLFTNTNNTSQPTNTQRLTEAAQRSPSNVSIFIFFSSIEFLFVFLLSSRFNKSLPLVLHHFPVKFVIFVLLPLHKERILQLVLPIQQQLPIVHQHL